MKSTIVRITAAIAAAAAVLCCCACAPLPAERDVDWRHGARSGWIAGFYGPETPRAELPPCLAGLSPQELAAQRYARIDYRHTRRMLVEVAALPDAVPVRLGDRVELWPQDCEQGRLSRISRVMPAAAGAS